MSSLQKDLPYYAEGTVVTGFGRGGKELGVPTANFPEDVVQGLPASFECGVYYGWAKLATDESVHKMVMSIGWNPYYHNTVKTMETHLMHKFEHDFYGDHLKVIVLGYIRPMSDFDSLDALISAIQSDIAEANKHLEEPACLKYAHDPFFTASPITTPSKSVKTTPVLAPAINNKCIQNGAVTSLSPDSSSFDKYAQKCCTSSSKSCESNHIFENRDVKDEPFYSKKQEHYLRDSGKSPSNSTKEFLKSEIILNGLTETEDASNICRLSLEDVYATQKVF